jgi:dipeptide/tripeptide permease
VTPFLRLRRTPPLPPLFFGLGLTLCSFTFLDVRCDVHKFPSPILSQSVFALFSKEVFSEEE